MTAEEFNAQCVNQLKAADFSNRVAVIGSGPSAPYITTMSTLLKGLATACKVVVNDDDYPWDTCEKAFAADSAAYFKQIRDSFIAMNWDARAYKHLVKIGFKGYVTFNYDDQLPQAYFDRFPDEKDFFSVYPGVDGLGLKQPSDMEHRRRVVAIHGYADEKNGDWPKQVILRTSDYNRHYVGPETGLRLYTWWKDLLTRYPCVFMGTSLREPGLDRVLEDLRKDGNPLLPKMDHIHLCGVDRAEKDPFYSPLTPTFGVFRKVGYDKLDAGHRGLLEVLSKFSLIPTASPSPAVQPVRSITVGDSFSFDTP